MENKKRNLLAWAAQWELLRDLGPFLSSRVSGKAALLKAQWSRKKEVQGIFHSACTQNERMLTISVKIVLLKSCRSHYNDPPMDFYSFITLRSLPFLSIQDDLVCFFQLAILHNFRLQEMFLGMTWQLT